MKYLMVPVMALGLAAMATGVGCATDPTDPAESSVSSDVSENANNFVLACGGLALRTIDDPNGPVKDTFGYQTVVHVGQVDWVTRMASVNSPKNGWMRIDGANGPLLSAALTGCN